MHLSEPLLRALHTERAAALVLDREGRIGAYNPRWDACAREDGAPPGVLGASLVGSYWLDAIHGEVRAFYSDLLERALFQPRSERPAALVHEGECNTPRLLRRIRTRLVPLHAGEECYPDCLLVLYDTLSVDPVELRYRGVAALPGVHRSAGGLIVQCSACGRVRNLRTRGWDFVPVLLAQRDPRTAHGLCDTCLETYYGEPVVERRAPLARSLLRALSPSP